MRQWSCYCIGQSVCYWLEKENSMQYGHVTAKGSIIGWLIHYTETTVYTFSDHESEQQHRTMTFAELPNHPCLLIIVWEARFNRLHHSLCADACDIATMKNLNNRISKYLKCTTHFSVFYRCIYVPKLPNFPDCHTLGTMISVLLTPKIISINSAQWNQNLIFLNIFLFQYLSLTTSTFFLNKLFHQRPLLQNHNRTKTKSFTVYNFTVYTIYWLVSIKYIQNKV